jgi:hypothetical protein
MLKLTNKWRKILTAIGERQFNGWTQLGVCLLNVSYADQQPFERRLKKVMQNVRSRWRDPLHENTLILQNGPPKRRDAIVGYAYKRISPERRGAMSNSIISTAAVEASAHRVAVIGVDCDEAKIPDSVLAFVPSVTLDAQCRPRCCPFDECYEAESALVESVAKWMDEEWRQSSFVAL